MAACLLQLSAQREASFNVLGNMTEKGEIFSASITASYKNLVLCYSDLISLKEAGAFIISFYWGFFMSYYQRYMIWEGGVTNKINNGKKKSGNSTNICSKAALPRLKTLFFCFTNKENKSETCHVSTLRGSVVCRTQCYRSNALGSHGNCPWTSGRCFYTNWGTITSTHLRCNLKFGASTHRQELQRIKPPIIQSLENMNNHHTYFGLRLGLYFLKQFSISGLTNNTTVI